MRRLMVQALNAPGPLILPLELCYLGWEFEIPSERPSVADPASPFTTTHLPYAYFKLAEKLAAYGGSKGVLPLTKNSTPTSRWLMSSADQFGSFREQPELYPIPAAEFSGIRQQPRYFRDLLHDKFYFDYGMGNPAKAEKLLSAVSGENGWPKRVYGIDLEIHAAGLRRAVIHNTFHAASASLKAAHGKPRFVNVRYDMFGPLPNDAALSLSDTFYGKLQPNDLFARFGLAAMQFGPDKRHRYLYILDKIRATGGGMVTGMWGGTFGNVPHAERIRHLQFVSRFHGPDTLSIFGVDSTSDPETLTRIYDLPGKRDAPRRFRQLFLRSFVQTCWTLGVNLDLEDVEASAPNMPIINEGRAVVPTIELARDYEIPALPGKVLRRGKLTFDALNKPSVATFSAEMNSVGAQVKHIITCPSPSRELPLGYNLLVARHG